MSTKVAFVLISINMFVHVSRIPNLQNHDFFVVFFSKKVEIKNVAKIVYFHKIKTLCSFFKKKDIFGEKDIVDSLDL